MLQGLFPAINWDAPHYVTWMHDNSKYGSGHGSLLAWLTMPVLASIDTAHFGTFTLNPFALLFVPFLLLVRRPPPGVTFLAAYAGLYFAIWAGSSQQTRFLHPVVPQGMAVAAALLFAPATATRWFRWPVALAAAWIFAVSWFGQVQNRYSNNALWPYTMGHLNPNELKNIGVSYHEAVKTVNRVVGARDRVLFVGADESFNCARRRICNSIYDAPWLGALARRARSAEELLVLLRRNRVTHLLVHEPRAEENSGYGVFDWGEPARQRFLDVWNTHGRLVTLTRGVFVFELSKQPLPPRERKTGAPAYFASDEVRAKAHRLTGEADRAFNAGKIKEAFEASDALVKLLPKAPYTHSYRGYALSEMNKREGAIADYEEAIRLGYPPATVYYNDALLLEDAGKPDRALERHLNALAVDPGIGRSRERAFDLAVKLKRREVAAKLGADLLAERGLDPALRERVQKYLAPPRRP